MGNFSVRRFIVNEGKLSKGKLTQLLLLFASQDLC